MPSAYPSHLLFVLGMHRSGTSALSRIFNLLGFSAPKTLMKANASNQKGHWESTPIARLNDEILAAMQLDWSDWSVGNTAGLRAKARANFYDDILSTLAQEFPEGRPAVVKDPRICRLMDFYRQALEEETIAASAIIPVRNPLAVMRSLEARNGMSETDAGLLWLKHVLDAVELSAGMPRAFVSYETLLKSPVETVKTLIDTLRIDTPYDVAAVEDQISEFLSTDLQHHSFGSIDVAHDPYTGTWIKDAYEAMLVLCKDPTSKSALERLSELRVQFASANDMLLAVSGSFGSRDTRRLEDIAELEDRVEALDAEVTGLREENATARARNQTLEKSLQTEKNNGANLQKRTAELDNTLTRLKVREKELRQLKRQFYRLKDELAWTKDLIHQLEGSTSWKVTSPLRKSVRLIRRLLIGRQAEAPAFPGRAPANGQAYASDPSLAQTELKPIDARPVSPAELAEQIGVLERSTAFDKAYYLSAHPDSQLHPEGPEAHYILEGWRKGYRPNPTFETFAYLAANPELQEQNLCPLVHFIRAQEKAQNGRANGLNGASSTERPRIAIYTAISGGYDSLKDPEHVSEHADYFVFTDGEVPEDSIWQPRPFEFVSHDPTRTARFIKTHPHLYFKDYDWAIWMDANLQLVASPDELVPPSDSGETFLTWHHPLRDCVYDEGRECIERSKDKSSGIEAQLESLRARGYPEHAGLFETSVLVAKMNDDKVEEMLKIWWAEISRWSKRDQLSLPVAVEAADLAVGLLARPSVCMRTDPRFVYYRHSA